MKITTSRFLFLPALAITVVHAQEARVWTDKTTGRTLTAVFVSADADTGAVTIRTQEGREFTLPAARFSDADLAYVREKAAPRMTRVPNAAPTPPAAPATLVVSAASRPAPPPPVIKVTALKAFKAPAADDFIRSVPRTRPRLLHTAQSWAALKGQVGSDPLLAALLDQLMKDGEAMLQQPEMIKNFGQDTRDRETGQGAQALCRIATFGTLHFMNGGPQWAERTVRELEVLTTEFPHWTPERMDFCADYTIAVALGYDWFHGAMSDKQRKQARTYLVQKGMEALEAQLKRLPLPASTREAVPGQAKQKTAKPATRPTGRDNKLPPSEKEMFAASALLMAAIALADEEPDAAKKAAAAAAKLFAEGITLFAPGGLWPGPIPEGDAVLDSVAMVLQTLRVSCGGDLGLGTLEGFSQASIARLHLTGPMGLFNYGDATAGPLARPWVSTWLAGQQGNPGTAALSVAAAGATPTTTCPFLQLAGHLIYYNPWAAGDGSPPPPSAVIHGAEIATLRSGWRDPQAAFIALKGGDNRLPASQLDLGSFVLDLAGVRWAVELGGENYTFVANYAPGLVGRHGIYLAGTRGQNTLILGAGKQSEDDPGRGPLQPGVMQPGNQPLEARAKIIGFNTSAGRSIAVVDLSEAYKPKAATVRRGAMLIREGTVPCVVLQDDIELKNDTDVEWRMHTFADIAVSGSQATLTSGLPGKQTKLTAVLLSPAGAVFSTTAPPSKEKQSVFLLNLSACHILQVRVPNAKGPQRITIAFAPGEQAPAAPPVVPLEQWFPRKEISIQQP